MRDVIRNCGHLASSICLYWELWTHWRQFLYINLVFLFVTLNRSFLVGSYTSRYNYIKVIVKSQLLQSNIIDYYLSMAYLKSFKHLRWSVLRIWLTTKRTSLFSQNVASWIFDRVLNTPLGVVEILPGNSSAKCNPSWYLPAQS